MNINIDRKQVIANLTEKRAEFNGLLLDAVRKQAELDEARKQWKKKTAEAVAFWIQQGDVAIDSFYISHGSSTSVRMEIPHRLDSEPRWDSDIMGHGPTHYEYKIAAIDKTLALLNMCTDDTIKSKAYADVLEFLF